MKKRALKIALSEQRAEVTARKDAHSRRVARILSTPKINDAYSKYVSALFKKAFNGEEVNEAEEAEAKMNYVKTLAEFGYSESDMNYRPFCPVCNDNGYVDGKLCRCVRARYIGILKEVCDIENRAPFTFADANFEVAKDDTQREALQKLFAFGKAWADRLPQVNTKSLVFFGSAGTGKTFLSSAIARETIERGNSVQYVSAYEFNSAMLSVHTSPLAEREYKLNDYLTSDLLVIDDLGTEPMLKNVTLEYLLLVLEERTNKGLCTLITTNLSPSRLLNRYGERIYSRLASKQTSRIFEFKGNDLRIN